jgi:mono/diheme cytochrome c family protein
MGDAVVQHLKKDENINKEIQKKEIHIKKEEEQSYALYFFILAGLLVAVSVWVLVWETCTLRPWKQYQKEYNKLAVTALNKELDTATKELSSGAAKADYDKLQTSLKEEETKFNSDSVASEYKKLASELEEIGGKIKEKRHEFQHERAKFQLVEHRYIKYGDKKDEAEMKTLESAIAKYGAELKVLEDQKSEIVKKQTALSSNLEKIRADLKKATSTVDNLKAQVTAFKDKKIEIKQIFIPDLDTVDRCQSCHVGIDRAAHVSDKEPFTSHPGKQIYFGNHKIDSFGCTACHKGQGRATSSAEKGHGYEEHWDNPMLKGNNVQASCIVCHENVKNLRGAETLSNGIETMERRGCYGCHKIAGYENVPKIGPVLSGIGTKANYTWVKNWIMHPKSVFPTARMPRFGFTEKEAEAIADYLFKLDTGNRVDVPAKKVDWTLYDKGKGLWGQSRCSICHPAMGKGGSFKKVYAPDLSRIGSKVNIEWLKKWLKNPQDYYPKTRMPRFRFTDDEIAALAEYLAGEYVDMDLEGKKLKEPVPIDDKNMQLGASLIEKYGCFGCHDIKGMENATKIGPFLKKKDVMNKIGAEIGSIGTKPFSRFDLGKVADKVHDRGSYISMKLKSPRVFRDGLLMPDFEFEDADVEGLTTMLLGFSAKEVPAAYKVINKSYDYKPTGDFAKVEKEVKCLTCHSIKGVGGGYAPDLTLEGSKVTVEWLTNFLKVPDMLRPMLQQMPKFNLGSPIGMIRGKLSDNEVNVIVTYIMNVLVSSDVPDDTEMEERLANVNAEDGKTVFMAKGCISCHQIGAGIGGAVGPLLSNAGKRLRPGYIYSHVKDPQKMVPGAVEPKVDMTDDEALKITKFLVGQRM